MEMLVYDSIPIGPTANEALSELKLLRHEGWY
jgi:hypothetical protein